MVHEITTSQSTHSTLPPQSRDHHRDRPSPPSPSPLRPTADVNPGVRARGRKPLASVRWEIEVAPVSHTLLNAAPTGSGALDWLGLATTAPSLRLCGGWSAAAGWEKDRQASRLRGSSGCLRAGSGEYGATAYVTFKERYALETAALLSNYQACQFNTTPQEALTVAQDVVKTMLARGYVLSKDALAKARAFVDETYRVTETTKTVATATGRTAAKLVNGIITSSYSSAGAMMVSDALTRAAKAAADLVAHGRQS
ncbi:uncharacterized protein C2845_PM15G26030 [Panicum miliaceum]|uniref:Binding partner of ACD11 1-like n=1 Tax=Panicum miliaceum TaxID=4540 RepID=A0A3L6QBI7_PANMI|nr:uncharacterized protein C2845_PM15G26030 [Panicum miliaceum]